jgi:hypothetical protein
MIPVKIIEIFIFWNKKGSREVKKIVIMVNFYLCNESMIKSCTDGDANLAVQKISVSTDVY